MEVFFKILAIIGIVLLSILGIILLAVLLVLFVPVRYRAEGSFKDNKPRLIAGGSWLLHIVSVRYTLGETDPLCIRIFGFKIKSKKEAEPDFEEDDDELIEYTPVNVPNEQSKVDYKAESVSSENVVSVTTVEKPAKEVSESSENTAEPEAKESLILKDEQVETSSKPESKPKKAKSKSEPNKNFENRSFYDKIKKYIEIIESRRFKKTFEYSKKKIFKLLKHICPRKLQIEGEVGFDDPSVTGQILVITSMLKPVLGKNVRIVGNFEDPIVSIEGKLKGHITVFRVLWTGAVLYFNKNIRKIIKMFREV
ncbi:hypothetical protein SAMN02910339_00162 [Lachnospiraceae bacterium YSD2013]|nr:hypothetical protein SAMN02910339_00162 [Lachnospiraceae bacterium YSD2013]